MAAINGQTTQGGHFQADADPLSPLDFRPKRHMTRWFEPLAMARLGLRIWSTRRMADQREQPVDQDCAVFDYSDSDEFWFDYVADLGDAFDPTMCVAWHLGRRHLLRSDIDPLAGLEPEYLDPDFVPRPPADDVPDILPRGRLLIMGGDQVYPDPSAARYRNQTVGPYRLGWEQGPSPSPEVGELVALPANHDWYGGIEPFRDVFCRGEMIGGRRTAQRASWWSCRLPHNWWLWGIDTGLDGSVNDAQYEYFRSVRKTMPIDARVIACIPTPVWRLRERHVDKLDTLARALLGLGVEPEVYLSGDYHIAALHRRDRSNGTAEWHLTSGGGGAFQHPVHNLDFTIPNRLGGLPEPAVADRAPFHLVARWPSPPESRSQAGGWWDLLFDRASASLIAALTALQFPLLWLTGADHRGPVDNARSVTETVIDQFVPFGAATAVTLIAIATFVLAQTTSSARGARSWARSVGFGHGAIQAGVFGAAQLFGNLLVRRWAESTIGTWATLAAAAAAASVMSIVVLGSYLRFANRRFRMHDNEAYSARPSGDNRHFARFRIGPDGSLSCYLIAIRKTGRGWAEGFRSGDPIPPESSSTPELTTVRFRTPPSN
jgi:hypothetical protein